MARSVTHFLTVSDTPPAKLNTVFQSQIKELYQEYYRVRIFAKPLTNDLEILHKLTGLSVYKSDSKVPDYARYIPAYQKEYNYPGLECTLASALLKLALEEAGYTKVHTLLLKGHQITARFDSNGVTLYDPSTRITRNGRTEGFNHMFTWKQVTFVKGSRDKIDDAIITIAAKEPINYTGMFSKHNGMYQNIFYVFPKDIYSHIAVIIENLESYFKKKDPVFSKQCTAFLAQHYKNYPSVQLSKAREDSFNA